MEFYIYTALPEKCKDEDNNLHETMALKLTVISNSLMSRIEIVHDVTTDRNHAYYLANTFNECQLAPEHFRDVLQDMLK